MKNHGTAILAAAMLLAGPAGAYAQRDQAERVLRSVTVFEEIMKAPDKAIPASLLHKADAVIVFPGTLKGGLGIGAHRGHGIFSVRDRKTNTWSRPAFMTLTGGSVGAQIGIEEVDVVLLVMDPKGVDNLVRNQFKIGADAGVAGGPVGRDAEASTDIQLHAQILSYSRTRGLFAGVTLKGSGITADEDANAAFYGRRLTTREIVFEGAGVSGDPVPVWLALLRNYFQ